MTSENEPKEFWVTEGFWAKIEPVHHAFERQVEKDISRENLIHVIEHSAYQQSQEAIKAALPLLEMYQGNNKEVSRVAEMVRKAIG